jgi:hypothetical protein
MNRLINLGCVVLFSLFVFTFLGIISILTYQLLMYLMHQIYAINPFCVWVFWFGVIVFASEVYAREEKK